MGDGTKEVTAAVHEQQTTDYKSELCFSRKVNTKLLITEKKKETKQQVMITPQQQTTKSEDKSELSIGYIGMKLPTTIVPGISLVTFKNRRKSG